MFARNTRKVMFESILKNVQIIRLSNFFWQIIPYINYTYKKRVFNTI